MVNAVEERNSHPARLWPGVHSEKVVATLPLASTSSLGQHFGYSARAPGTRKLARPVDAGTSCTIVMHRRMPIL